MLCALIMAGGRGERFWPLSRINRPKQFLNLTGNETMIQATARRINRLIPYEDIYVVTSPIYKELVKEQLPLLGERNIIMEPMSKNTAACIGLASMFIKNRYKDACMIVLPSDHLITEEQSFINLVNIGFKKAQDGEYLVAFGTKPHYPETGYGYIKFKNAEEDLCCSVERFIEKPSLEKAQEYLSQENYLWNSGMYIWRIETIMSKFKVHMPELYESILRIEGFIGENEQDHIIKKEFMKLEDISIDCGVMEKTKDLYVIHCDIGWDDVGSWASLERMNAKDQQGNILKGKVIGLGIHGCIVKGDKKLIATMGIEDLVVVDTDDAILICKKDRAQDMKQLIREIQESNMYTYL